MAFKGFCIWTLQIH